MNGVIPRELALLCGAGRWGLALRRLGEICFAQLGLALRLSLHNLGTAHPPSSVQRVGLQLTQQLQVLAPLLLVPWPDPSKPSAGFLASITLQRSRFNLSYRAEANALQSTA